MPIARPVLFADRLLNIELDLLKHWKSKYKNDHILEEQIKHLILNDITAISIIKPNIDDLQGVPLDVMYRLSVLNHHNSLSLKKYGDAFKPALSYISNVEDTVKRKIEERNNSRKKLFKKIMGKP